MGGKEEAVGKYGWKITVPHAKMNRLVTLFVNREPTVLLLDIKDKGTEYLERTLPAHVKVFYQIGRASCRERVLTSV